MQNSDSQAYNDSGVTPRPKQDTRNRIQFRFWLDANKPIENEMGLKLDAMKADKRKSFAQFMRDAIRLMFALLVGDTSVLSELFPSVVDNIKAQAIAEYQNNKANDQFEAIVNQAMQRIEKKLETVSVAAVVEPIEASIPQQSGLQPLGGLQPLTAAPLDYDDDMVLEVTKATSDLNASKNFLDAMNALQGSR